MRFLLLFCAITLCGFSFVLFFQSTIIDWYGRNVAYGWKFVGKPTSVKRKIDPKAFEKCSLKQRDPWGGDIDMFLDLDYEKKPCNRSFVPMTFLKEGQVFIRNEFVESHKCSASDPVCPASVLPDFTKAFRCVLYLTDRKTMIGEMIIVGNHGSRRFHCDFIYAECRRKEEKLIDYGYIHVQIRERKLAPRNDSVDHKRYNVHVILIDSTSSTQAYRNLPATMNFLEKSMDSITFPFLNRIGTNSAPNGIALWFGKLLRAVDKSLLSMDDIPADISEKAMCSEFYDDYWPTIMKDFKNFGGYTTMLAEDWGLFYSQECKGLRSPPTDHYTKPLENFLENTKKMPAFKKTSKRNSCTRPDHLLLEYLDEFLRKYPNAPKLSWTWMSQVSHELPYISMAADKDLLQLFLNRRKELDDSFVIFMSDHGFRFGNIAQWSSLAKYDMNNPMLTIALPKELRDNRKLVNTMRNNSKYLQTHFDVRATLLDILKVSDTYRKNNASMSGFFLLHGNMDPALRSYPLLSGRGGETYQPFTNFTSHEPKKMEGERGESLMRRQDTPRNCKVLPIPYEYCLCQFSIEPVATNTSIAREVSTAVVEYLNNLLREQVVKHLCKKLEYDETLELTRYVENANAYRVSFRTSGPAFATFQTTVIMPSEATKFSIKIGSIDRLDIYGNMGACVYGDMEKYCVCMSWLEYQKMKS